MNWWDNVSGQGGLMPSPWWGQTQAQQPQATTPAAQSQSQGQPGSIFMRLMSRIGATSNGSIFSQMVQGGQQAQQSTAVQGVAQQPATVKPPVPLAPGAGIGSMPGIGGAKANPTNSTLGSIWGVKKPNWGEMTSPGMRQVLNSAGVPVRLYNPYRYDPSVLSRERMSIGMPSARVNLKKAYLDGGEYAQPPKPTTPTTTTTAGTGDGGGGYSGGYFSGSGYSYKAPKQPWYMELMSWNIGE